MCLIAFRWQPGDERPLVMAANRDEFHDRPTRPLSWWTWPDGPLAGRDAQAGGTWMAVGRDGRFAAVTNYRDPHACAGERSRGELPGAWLAFAGDADAFADGVAERRKDYAPFNLVFGDRRACWIVGTHAEPDAVAPGLHALSNHLLDTPWPKATRAVRRLDGLLAQASPETGQLLDLLDDREPAPGHELPDTGIGEELERLLSPPFVVSPRYGTRSSTALVLGTTACVAERTFTPEGTAAGERRFCWRLGYRPGGP